MWSKTVMALVVGSLLVACETAPPPVPTPPPAPAVVSLQEYMQQAGRASKDGNRDGVRQTYRAAAKAYPASKEPWVKLAEDYFEAADYGNAILAAQEVLARDTSDGAAPSILAVSGLRVSASALQVLRGQNQIAGGTRTEAETMARTLREVLGEPVLVPRPAPAPRPRAPRPAASAASAAKPAVKPSANPFDQLK